MSKIGTKGKNHTNTGCKRLFKVEIANEIRYFDNKMEAKKFRDANPGSKVQRGPGHHLGETF